MKEMEISCDDYVKSNIDNIWDTKMKEHVKEMEIF